MPPRFGASSAAATPPTTATAVSIPAARPRSANPILPSRSASLFLACSLFVEPDRRQILVQEMARADLPALHIGAVRHDAVPPDDLRGVRLGIHQLLLEIDHERVLLLLIAFLLYLVIDRGNFLIVVKTV